MSAPIEDRISRLQAGGVVDLHFDLPMGLFLSLPRRGVVATDFLPALEHGDVSVLGVAIYIDDENVGANALRVALDQVALLLEEIEANPRLVLCRSYAEIEQARREKRIALLLTMEGAEPLGQDLHLLRVFHQLGLRSLSLTHARVNAAGAGGIFAASGSPATGLTDFGRALVRECGRLGIILDLAHINPAGFEEVCGLTSGPLIISHTNARRFHDLERNVSDAQIRMIGARGGVIGVNAVLTSAKREEATLDRYVNHIEHMTNLIGEDAVAIGFDFCEFLFTLLPAAERDALAKQPTHAHFLPELNDHGQVRNLTRKLIERGFSDARIEKFLRRNWLRLLRELL